MGDDALGTGVSEADVAGGYDEATKARLEAELRARGLDDGGSTADLVARLREDDAGPSEGDAEPSDDAPAPHNAGPSEDDAQASDDDAPVAEDEAREPGSGGSDGEPDTAETGAPSEAGSEGEAGASRGAQRATRTRRSAPRRTADPPTRRAARFASRSTGLRLDTVSKAVHDDDRWYIQVELVEVPHVPPSRDILGTYVVVIDDGGDVAGMERMGQYRRRG